MKQLMGNQGQFTSQKQPVSDNAVSDPFLATREAIQWYQAHTVLLFQNSDNQSRCVAVCETTAGRRTIQTIESASDEEELCDCYESNHSNWVNRICHSIIHHTRLFLCDHGEWSFQIVSDFCHSRRIGIDIRMAFTPITSMTHWSSHSESIDIILRLHTCFQPPEVSVTSSLFSFSISQISTDWSPT